MTDDGTVTVGIAAETARVAICVSANGQSITFQCVPKYAEFLARQIVGAAEFVRDVSSGGKR